MLPLNSIVDAMRANLDLLNMTIEDMTDADLMKRPTPSANHAIWQIGHLISSEVYFVDGCQNGASYKLPTGFNEKYTKSTSKIDDQKKFHTKAELIEIFSKVRASTINWIQNLKAEDYSKPAPKEIQAFAPTVARVILLMPGHVDMHVGQIQVLRRALGKPVLF